MKNSNQEFINAIKSSISIREALVKLNLSATGGNYRSFHNRVKQLNIDTSHFKGKGWNKGRNFGPKRPLQDYLSNRYEIQSYKLHKRLIAEGIFQKQCASCERTKWMNSSIPLELHHKDGNKFNNNLENLILLCPNCHSLTHTHRGKNKRKSS